MRQTLLARDWETLKKGEKKDEETGKERRRESKRELEEETDTEHKAGVCDGTRVTAGRGY